MTSKRDYYEILGITKQATEDEIKRAYRKLAMQYHPDRNPGDTEAEQKFREASEAYDVLHDAEKRARYDRYGHAGLEGIGMPHFADTESIFGAFGDILNDLLGGGFGGRRQRRAGPRQGRDVQVLLEVDLLEAAKGVIRTIELEREENCGECNGTGTRKGSQPAPCSRCQGRGVVIMRQGFFQVQTTCNACGGRGTIINDPCHGCRGHGRVAAVRKLEVKVPAGVDTGDRLSCPGEGEAGEYGGPRGDLYCVLRVRQHPFFERDGLDLICQWPITFSQAALGAEVEIPTLHLGQASLKVTAGSQTGDVFRIKAKGMPSARGRGQGDLLVQVVVETPKKLTKRQEELFRELAEIDQKHVSPERKSFLERIKSWFVSEEAKEPEEEKP